MRTVRHRGIRSHHEVDASRRRGRVAASARRCVGSRRWSPIRRHRRRPVVRAVHGLGAGGEYHPLTPAAHLRLARPASPVNESRRRAPSRSAPEPADVRHPAARPRRHPRPTPPTCSPSSSTSPSPSPTRDGYLERLRHRRASRRSRRRSSTSTPARRCPTSRSCGPAPTASSPIKLLRPAAGTAHVIVDVFGWFSTSARRRTDTAPA